MGKFAALFEKYDRLFLFDTEQIGQIYQIGYLDVESINFKLRADEEIKKLKREHR